MRLSSLVYFYARRLRTSPLQEFLAGVGIAIGVALVLAVQVANSSITDASTAIVKGIAGNATIQLRSRGQSGFSEALYEQVERLPGVARAAPILDEPATITGPDGRVVAIELACAAPSLLLLEGSITHRISLHDSSARGVILPAATAKALGLESGSATNTAQEVVLDVRGRAVPVKVIAVLGKEALGGLSGAMAAIATLRFGQEATGLPGQITRVLVRPKPGQEALVRKELGVLAAGRLTVAPADEDVALLKQALAPNAQATGFFVLVSAIVGLLIAFNAMLLTVPDRRRMIADLRMQGLKPGQLVQMLLFQAICLGVVASLVGLAAGDLLARTLFHTTPNYLAAAFPLGTQTVISLRPVLIALAGGVIASCVAASPPLLDLRRGRAVDAVYFEDGQPGQALGRQAHLRLFLAGVVLLVLTNGLLIVWPGAVAVAIAGLALATLLSIPLCFRMVLAVAGRLAAPRWRLNMLTTAVHALRDTTLRSLALAATGSIAVFGCVVAEDSHNDLLHGLYSDYNEYVSTANLWIVNNDDDLATNSFPAGRLAARIASVPGVASVRGYQGSFLNFAGRRVWVLARAPSTVTPIPLNQIEAGNLSTATARLQQGGWITVSRQLAEAHHVGPGDVLSLPTPAGHADYRVAATTTNLGWSAGAIVMNSNDYGRAWATTELSAVEIDTTPGAEETTIQGALRRILGPSSALKVQTSSERALEADELASQGLSRLSQISKLLMIAAALALAAAMGAGVWQRRTALASLRLSSYSPRQIRLVIAYETLLVLGTGALTGAITGIYGHFLVDRFLRLTTGFPAPFAVQGLHTLQTILLITVGAFAVFCAPGYIASNVPPQLALQE